MSCSVYGISESFSRGLEWRNSGGYNLESPMLRREASPSIRATDYKCPKYVWYVVED